MNYKLIFSITFFIMFFQRFVFFWGNINKGKIYIYIYNQLSAAAVPCTFDETHITLLYKGTCVNRSLKSLKCFEHHGKLLELKDSDETSFLCD